MLKNQNKTLELFRTKILTTYSLHITAFSQEENRFQGTVSKAFEPILEIGEKLILRELELHQQRLKAKVTKVISDQSFEFMVMQETKEDLRVYPRMLMNLSFDLYVPHQDQIATIKDMIDHQDHERLLAYIQKLNLTKYQVAEDLINFSVGGLQFESKTLPFSQGDDLLCHLRIKGESFLILAQSIRIEQRQGNDCHCYAIQWTYFPSSINDKFSEITLELQNSLFSTLVPIKD